LRLEVANFMLYGHLCHIPASPLILQRRRIRPDRVARTCTSAREWESVYMQWSGRSRPQFCRGVDGPRAARAAASADAARHATKHATSRASTRDSTHGTRHGTAGAATGATSHAARDAASQATSDAVCDAAHDAAIDEPAEATQHTAHDAFAGATTHASPHASRGPIAPPARGLIFPDSMSGPRVRVPPASRPAQAVFLTMQPAAGKPYAVTGEEP